MTFRTKLLCIMKLSTLMIFAACLTVSARSVSQQVSLKVKNVSLESALQTIRQQTGYSFFYNDKDIAKAKSVTVSLSNAPITQAMDEVLKDQPLRYEIKGMTIVISPKEAKPLGAITEGLSPRLESPLPPTVRGRITNEKGEPVAGVSISVKGGKVIGVTNDNGEFVLVNIADNATLVFTAVTIETFETKLNGRNELALIAKIKVSELEEVVINKGYYSEKKRLSTGNVKTVSSKDIEKQPVLNPLLALQGLVPGLVITQTNGLPGGAVSVNILGQNSITNGNDPFYVIDGIPYISQMPNTVGYGTNTLGGLLGNNGSGNPLSYLNPSDIESIDVLKDADATAIYGSRAANGAILITTKKGHLGVAKTEISLQSGIGNVASKLKLLNSRQYIDMRLEAKRNDNSAMSSTDWDINGTYDTTRYTDWQKELFGSTAHYTNATGSISGGVNNSRYIFSSTYQRQTSVFPGSFSDAKGSVHFSFSTSTNNQKLKFQVSGSYMSDKNTLPNTDLTSTALNLAPTAPALYDANGDLNWQVDGTGVSTFTNPLAYILQPYKNQTDNLLANAVLSYQLPAGFELKTSFGMSKLTVDENTIFPLNGNKPEDRLNSTRGAFFNKSAANGWIVEPQATYTKIIGAGRLNVLAGSTFQSNNINGYALMATGQNSDAVLGDIRSAVSVSSIASTISAYHYSAFFGRINYVLQDKYIFNLTGRRDGSSRFGPGNSFKNFGAVAAAWVFSEEEFIKKSTIINYGKLKLSWGSTGNDQIGEYKYFSLYNPISVSLPYQNTVSLEPTSLSNPLLQWEAKTSFDIGAEAGLFKDRIFVTVNYSQNRSSNQLIGYALPLMTGFSSITSNFPATVQNTVWEFQLNTTIVKGAKFLWKSNINLTLPKNKLIAFENLAQSSYASQLIIGKPVSINRVYHFLGVDPATGLYQVASRSGVAATSPSEVDKTVLINTLPKLYGGIQQSFSYGNFQFDFLFQFMSRTSKNYFGGAARPGLLRQNEPVSVLERWQKPGDIAIVQRFGTAGTLSAPYRNMQNSDASYSDASFIRMKNISLAWKVDASWLKKTGLKSLNVFINAQNLFTITKYDGLDPETGNSALPPMRMITAGVQASL